MGIRINSAVVYGVRFSKKETKAYEKFMADKPRFWFLMKHIENQLALDWKKKESKAPRSYDCFFSHYFMKISPETKTAVHPYKPFWYGMSGEEMKRVERDIFDAASDYMKAVGREDICGSLKRNFFIWPELQTDGEPKNILGYVQERNYAREVDYALVDIKCLQGGALEDKIIPVPGSYPWETGTDYDKKSKQWWTCNGQHMVNLDKLPEEEKTEVYNQICTFKGRKKQFLNRKKEIWDKYHGNRRPYKCYSGEGWFGSDFYFYSMDMLFKLISEHIPEIKYNVMRLDKFLCFYWC